MVTSECEPFAKTGGLADVVDALSRALGAAGHEVDVYLPPLPRPGGARPTLRGAAARGAHGRRPRGRASRGGGRARPRRRCGRRRSTATACAWSTTRPASTATASTATPGGDYPDNAARFTLLGRAALEADARRGAAGGRAPRPRLAGRAGRSCRCARRYAYDPLIARTATMLTCHNLAYHGWVPRERAWAARPARRRGRSGTAWTCCARRSAPPTSSTRSARPTLRSRSRPSTAPASTTSCATRGDRYIGDPQRHRHPRSGTPRPTRRSRRATPRDDPAGKAPAGPTCARRHGLDPDGPVFGLVGRLDPQKGFDLVTDAAPALLDAGARLVVLGTGDDRLVAGLRAPRRRATRPGGGPRPLRPGRGAPHLRRRGRVPDAVALRAVRTGPAHRAALRHGAAGAAHGRPRRHGGRCRRGPRGGQRLRVRAGEPEALIEAVGRAVAAYGDRERWAEVQRRGMRIDLSWAVPAARYEEAYRRLRR